MLITPGWKQKDLTCSSEYSAGSDLSSETGNPWASKGPCEMVGLFCACESILQNGHVSSPHNALNQHKDWPALVTELFSHAQVLQVRYQVRWLGIYLGSSYAAVACEEENLTFKLSEQHFFPEQKCLQIKNKSRLANWGKNRNQSCAIWCDNGSQMIRAPGKSVWVLTWHWKGKSRSKVLKIQCHLITLWKGSIVYPVHL